MKDRNLYKVNTVGCGDFYVVTSSWDSAAENVKSELDNADYGYSCDRKVESIELIRTEHFFNKRRFFSGDNDINKFIVVDE